MQSQCMSGKTQQCLNLTCALCMWIFLTPNAKINCPPEKMPAFQFTNATKYHRIYSNNVPFLSRLNAQKKWLGWMACLGPELESSLLKAFIQQCCIRVFLWVILMFAQLAEMCEGLWLTNIAQTGQPFSVERCVGFCGFWLPHKVLNECVMY